MELYSLLLRFVMRRSKRLVGQQTSRRRLILESLEDRRLLAAGVSGQVFLDSGAGGIQIYADSNGNGVFDSGETSTLTAADGTYSLGNLPAGETIVRVQPIPVALNSGALPTAPRLFMAAGQVIQELSPIDGSVIDSFPATSSPVAGAEPMALAFDGTHVYMYDGFVHDVIVFNPDASVGTSHVVDTIVVDNDYSFSGLAVLGSTLYGLSDKFGSPELIVPIDLTTQTVGTPIDFDLVNNSPGYELAFGLGESADGTELVVSTTTQHRLNLDPATGLITGVATGPNANAVSTGLAGAAGRLYAGRGAAFGIEVFDDSGSQLAFLPTWPIGNTFSGVARSLAAGPSQGNSILVHLQDNTTRDGVNFYSSNETATITGTQFVDANNNGVFDTGEQPLAGVTVFVDFNGNQWPDAGEFQAISGVDGSYTIAGVPVGSHEIRAVTDTSHRPIDSAPQTDRLFAIAPGAPLGNNDFSMRVIELDVGTEAVLSDIDTGLPITFASEVAFDGDRLIVFDDWKDRVYELTTDGTLIDSRSLGEPDLTGGGTFPVSDFGPSFVGDSVVSVRGIYNQLSLTQYNPATNDFEYRMPIQIDWQDQSTPPFDVPAMPKRFAPTSGRSPDGKGIVLYAYSDNRTLTIDIATGIGTFDTDDFTGEVFTTSRSDYEAYESLGGLTYRSRVGGQIEVLNASGLLQNTIPTNFFTYGLGGGTDRDNVQAVTVSSDQTIDDVDIAWTSTRATISGTVSGIGDPAADPDQVYLDIDGDGQLGVGEPSALVDAAGDYVLTDVAPGDYQVRVVERADEVTRATAADTSRLFAYYIDEGVGKIAEIEPITGERLQTFDAPGFASLTSGLAAQQGRLYFTQGSTLFILDADTGSTIETLQIPLNININGTAGEYSGAAIVDSSLYLYNESTSVLVEFDLVTREFREGLDLVTINDAFGSASDAGIGESPDGQNLLIEFEGRIHLLDPKTGVIDEEPYSFFPSSTGTGTLLRSLAGAGGRWFAPESQGSSTTRTIDVRDDSTAVTHQLIVGLPGIVRGLAAQQTAATAHRVSVYGNDNVDQLDFERLPDTGTISGTQFVDANDNGIFDDGEQPLAGAVIFVDANANDWPDTDEIQTVSGADGTYTLTDVPIGNALVRALPPDSYRVSSNHDVQDRLFVASLGQSTGPGRFALTLLELAPQSGAILSDVATGIGVGGNFSIAFDGRHLIGVDNIHDQIYTFSTNGQLIDQRSLAVGLGTPGVPIDSHFGAVYVGDSVVTMTRQGNNLHLSRYDSATNAFQVQIPVTMQWADPFLAQGYAGFVQPDFWFAGRAIEDDAIEMYHQRDQLKLTIDINTGIGLIEEVSSQQYRLTESVAGETYRSVGSTRLEVVNSADEVQRTYFLPVSPRDLAAGSYRPSGSVVAVSPGQTVAAIDHPAIVKTSRVTGTVSGDDVAGRLLFIDINNNGIADSGEPSATSDSEGRYVIDGVGKGNHLLRMVTPEGLTGDATGQTSTRLFMQAFSGGGSVITEYDLFDGTTINSFAAPHNNFEAGLAMDGDRLYSIGGDSLYQIDPDSGALVDTIAVPPGRYEGLAILNSVAYFYDQQTYQLGSLDLLTRQFGPTFDLAQLNPLSNVPSAVGGLGETADGQGLLFGLSNTVVELNPNNGVFGDVSFFQFGNNGAIAGAGGQSFVVDDDTASTPKEIVIRGDAGLRQRSLIAFAAGTTQSLAASSLPSDSHRLLVLGDQSLAGRDFVLSPEPAGISGTLYQDANENGVFDSGESPLSDVIVFIDSNGNAWPDANEIRTLSDATGQYTLAQVPVGDAIVRTLAPKAYQSTEITSSTNVLFATEAVRDSSSVGNVQNLKISKINPVTGIVESTILTDIPVTSAHSMAYDGRQLIVVDTNLNKVYQVAIDGKLIAETPFGSPQFSPAPPIPGTPSFIAGNAVVGGVVYMLGAFDGVSTSIFSFDTETGQFGTPKPVTILHPSAGSNFPNFGLTLSESADGQSIIAFDQNEGVYSIDPATGRMTERRLVAGLGNEEFSSTGFGGEIYVRGVPFASGIRVFDSQWNQVREGPVVDVFAGLGGGVFNDSGKTVVVDASASSSLESINFGFRSTLATVSGTVVTDTNGDGVITVSDMPLSDATVYVDANRNGQFDDGEITVQTDASGNYEIVSLPPGDHDVRLLLGADQTASTNTPQTRLFVTDNGLPGPTLIRELDPITGQELNSFPAPVSASNFNTLALDAGGLLFGVANRLWTLDPDTGEVLSFVHAPGTGLGADLGDAVADGEAYLTGGFEITVQNENGFLTRRINLDFNPASVAAAVVPGVRHRLHAVRNSNFANTDFLVDGGQEPTGIEISDPSINENVDTSAGDFVFAQLSAVDASEIDSHVFELIDGIGDDDNDRFNIVGDQLAIRQDQIVDYESQQSYLIRIRVTDAAGSSVDRVMLIDVNDLAEFDGVLINGESNNSNRSRITSLTVEFEGLVTADSDAFTLTNTTTGIDVDYTFDPPSMADGQTIFELQFTGEQTDNGSLSDGNYELRIDAAKIDSTQGLPLDGNRDGIAAGTEEDDVWFGRQDGDRFFRLLGDSDGDGSVGLTDFAGFRSTFGRSIGDPEFDLSFDFDDNGEIGLIDFASFRSGFGKNL
ncbi:SdrD B-like domain-containing protein [Rubripirellula obstinata]|nr:SdrD B-like domain-containing protein [Rubripirellula obstinata]